MIRRDRLKYADKDSMESYMQLIILPNITLPTHILHFFFIKWGIQSVDHSKYFTLYLLADLLICFYTTSASDISRHVARYSFIQLSELGRRGERKFQIFETAAKGIRTRASSIESRLFYHWVAAVRGCAKKNKFQKSEITTEVGGWVQVSLGFLFCWKSSRNSSKPVQIFWSSIPYVFCLNTLLKVVSYYNLSVLSMSVMGFQKKVWMSGG